MKLTSVCNVIVLIGCCAGCHQQPDIAARQPEVALGPAGMPLPSKIIHTRYQQQLNYMSPRDLAALCKSILAKEEGKDQFFSTSPPENCQLNFMPPSNGALWLAIFDLNSIADRESRLKAFAEISIDIVNATLDSPGLPLEEKMGGVFALSVAFDKCGRYLKSSNVDRKGLWAPLIRANTTLVECSKDFTNGTTKSRFEKRLRELKAELVKFGDEIEKLH